MYSAFQVSYSIQTMTISDKDMKYVFEGLHSIPYLFSF
uniref:Uncharacterized protein n=1 Tax=Arundo donax TaxID=35708 RepID=A0A0A9G446_ARUDO